MSGRTIGIVSDDLGAVLVRPIGWEESPVVGDGFVLPTGTVTLLLGDVEGSTRGWESDPDTMVAAIARLNEVVDEGVGRHDGVRPVEQGEGDSFVAAFSRARDALGCAVWVQRRLAGEPIALRMGLHTGDVTRRGEGNYVGPTINRTARIRDLAHGGQVVVSQTTHDLVADAQVEGVELQDLGVHRLKDLARPERVFQVCHPDLRAEFPPLRSLDARAHNLPAMRTSFVGRAAEMAQVVAMVADAPLVTLTGSGGCGKTRLAIHAAAELLEQFPDGVWFVDLAPIDDPAAVADRVAAVLNVRVAPGTSAADALAGFLVAQEMLLIVDNCEHVLDGAAALVDRLLSDCPGTRILATSRQNLGVDGELSWRVPSLVVPAEGEPPGIEGIKQSDAVALFCDRAARARPGFVLAEDNAGVVAQICRRLDGIALAIELAAARARVFTPAQIAEGLSERFHLLTGGSRTSLARQQTLQASVDWSHNLLTAAEQAVFRRLAVFAGGFEIDAAEAVAVGGDIQRHQVLDLLSLLVDKSLVGVDDRGPRSRYRMLETIRAYAADRLTAAGEQDTTLDRHRDHYLAVAEQARAHLEGRGQVEWMARLHDDYPNLTAAMSHSERRGDAERLARAAAALALLWFYAGPAADGESWLDRALSYPLPVATQANALLGRAQLALVSFDVATLSARASEGLALGDVGEERTACLLRQLVGLSHAFLGVASSDLDAAVGQARHLGDEFVTAMGLFLVGARAALVGDIESWQLAFGEAASLGRRLGNVWLAGASDGNLALLMSFRGEFEAARRLLEEVEAVAASVGDVTTLTMCLMYRSSVLVETNQLDEALAVVADLEAAARQAGLPLMTLYASIRHGQIALGVGDVETALARARVAIDAPSVPVTRTEALSTLAHAELAAGLVGPARAHAVEIAALAQPGPPLNRLIGMILDARAARMDGDLELAESIAYESLDVAMSLPFLPRMADVFELLGGITAAAGRPERAARLFGTAQAIRDATGYARSVAERDADIAALRASVGADTFEAAFTQGRALSIEEAGDYARRSRGERKRPPTGWASLTPAETQTVELVRIGLTNAAIAERMFVSPRTVQTHLTHVYAKVGIGSRAQLAAEATRRATEQTRNPGRHETA